MNSEGSLLWQLLLLLVLMFINSFFTCAEVALLSLNKNRFEKMAAQGDRRAKRILALTRQPAKFIGSVQVAITLAGLLSSAFAAENFSWRLTERIVEAGSVIPAKTISTISLVIVTLILSFFTIVLCELLPKRIALKKTGSIVFASSGIVLLASKIFAPLVWLLTKTTNGLLRIIGISTETAPDEITEDEIRLMIDVGSAKGAIKAGEKEFLNNVFEFDNKTAGEVMTHRRDAVFLSLDDDDDEWERIITEYRHNNYPVQGSGPDDIRGILKARDYLILKEKTRGAVIKILRPAHFVPLSVRTDKLFSQMKKSRNHYAVVVDEYGSMMGIVTMSDLLEELVGDLEDDDTMPAEKPLIERAEDGWYIGGAAPLDTVARELDFKLPVEKYDTFAGFVFSLLGHIPPDGQKDEIEFEAQAGQGEEADYHTAGEKLIITTLEVRERRLEKALVRKLIENNP